MASLIAGFLLHIAQLANIGPQNIFILTNANTKQKQLSLLSICLLTDIVLIWIAVFGFVTPFVENKYISVILKFAGSAFLLKYGISCIIKAIKNNEHLTKSHRHSNKQFIINALFVSLVTPYVIIDTIAIATIANEYTGKFGFFIGNSIASIAWFSVLCFTGSKIYNLFNKNQTWRFINSFTGSVMIFMGFKLLFA